MSKEKTIFQRLTEYGNSNAYPFHMPGHKRQELGTGVEQLDITEITGFDNLHHAQGILKEGQERLARVFGADESFYLVNGSTCGLLAAISGCTKKGDTILVARNCHKAVYHGIYQMELNALYLVPEETDFGIQGSIDPEQVCQMLEEHRDIAAVLITSPTYDGVVSDVSSIAQIVHSHGIPLIVDEAHGAHFGFSKGFPQKAHTLGADLCIESVHKTLPAFTQSAVLHMKKQKMMTEAEQSGAGYYFDPDRVRRYLGIYQTSSPSYILMAGIDRSVDMVEREGEKLFTAFEARLNQFYEQCQDLSVIQVYPAGPATGIYDRDGSKILLDGTGASYNGEELFTYLRDQAGLELEMTAGHYATALTSLMDTAEGFERLARALHALDESAVPATEESVGAGEQQLQFQGLYTPGPSIMTMALAMDAEYETVPLEESAGRISCEFVYLYPPGIPVIAPGEEIPAQILKQLEVCRERGQEIEGMSDLDGMTIRVVR